MENLPEKTKRESKDLLDNKIRKEYAEIIDVNPEFDVFALEGIVYRSFFKNFYCPTIKNRISNISTSSLVILEGYAYGRNFTKKQLVRKLSKVLKIKKSEADKLLPGLLFGKFYLGDHGGRAAKFEAHPLKKEKYRLRING